MILAVGLTLLMVNSCFVNWRGTWSYGPRYLLPILPALSLPCIFLFEWVYALQRKILRISCILFLFVAGIFAASLQEGINRFPFYTWYQLDTALSNDYTPVLARYMYGTPFWQINKDISSYRSSKSSPLALLLVQDQYKVAREFICDLPLNYYWFK
jgi:hypothetical protein